MVKRLSLVIACSIAFWIGVRDLSYAQTPLPSTASCTEARAIAQAPAAPPGALTQEFIDCFEELLQVMRALLAQSLADDPVRRTGLTPFLSVYDTTVQKTMTVLREQVLPLATPADISDFEFVIRNITILDEISALQQLLETPSHSFPTLQDKKNILDIALESVKKILDVLIKNVTGLIKSILASIKIHFEVLKESADIVF